MNRIRSTGYIVFAVSLSACTSATTAGPNTVDRVIVQTDAGTVRANEALPKVAATVKSAPAVVLPILRDTYSELGIDAKVFDPATGAVGNRYFVKSYRLEDAALSKYLDCGGTITGPAADNYKITMSVLSVVSPNGAGSKIETLVSARADDAAGGSSLSCTTLGTLEAQLYRVLVRRLGDREL
jgi:hypothetical protein